MPANTHGKTLLELFNASGVERRSKGNYKTSSDYRRIKELCEQAIKSGEAHSLEMAFYLWATFYEDAYNGLNSKPKEKAHDAFHSRIAGALAEKSPASLYRAILNIRYRHNGHTESNVGDSVYADHVDKLRDMPLLHEVTACMASDLVSHIAPCIKSEENLKYAQSVGRQLGRLRKHKPYEDEVVALADAIIAGFRQDPNPTHLDIYRVIEPYTSIGKAKAMATAARRAPKAET